MKQKTKLVKRKAQPRKEEEPDWDKMVWANIDGIRTTVIHQTEFQPIPKSFLDRIFSVAQTKNEKYF